MNDSGGRHRRELVDRPSAAATDIENRVVLFDRDMAQAPIGQLGMMPIHVPQNKPAEESRRLPALSDYFVRRAHISCQVERALRSAFQIELGELDPPSLMRINNPWPIFRRGAQTRGNRILPNVIDLH